MGNDKWPTARRFVSSPSPLVLQHTEIRARAGSGDGRECAERANPVIIKFCLWSRAQREKRDCASIRQNKYRRALFIERNRKRALALEILYTQGPRERKEKR